MEMCSKKKRMRGIIRMALGVSRPPVSYEKPKSVIVMDSSLSKIKLPVLGGKKIEQPKVVKQADER